MTTLDYFFLIVAAGAVVLVVFFGLRKRLRRRRALRRPIPSHWEEIARRNLPPYEKLPADEQRRLLALVQAFLHDKNFEGCGGLDLTDEIRVTIAAQACLMVLKHPDAGYPRLDSILVYPSTYVARDEFDEEDIRFGESWQDGFVVLAWDSVKRGVANFEDGQNLVVHEFAHQLDQEDGAGDGAPILDSGSGYAIWSQVLSEDYERLREQAMKGRKTVMDHYGASHPAEFFAVASEAFFEKPLQLNRKHPELFEELLKFYRIDPREWA